MCSISPRWGNRDRVAWVRDLTSGRGADIVMNCANSHALPEGLRMARPGGRLVQVGVSGGADVAVPPMLFFRGVQILSTVMAKRGISIRRWNSSRPAANCSTSRN